MIATPKLEKLLEAIPAEWSSNDFVLCGSAVLAFEGIRDVNDLDILVRPHLFKKEPEETKTVTYGRVLSRRDGMDIMTTLPRIGDDAPDPFETAVVYRGVWRVLAPRHVLAIKALAFRKTDLDDMISLAELIKEQEL